MSPYLLQEMLNQWMILGTFSLAASLAIGVAWVRSLMRIRRLEKQLAERDPALLFAGTVEEIQRSLVDLNEQLDRVTADQEFLTRMVAGRPDFTPRPRTGEQLNTPH